MKTAEIAQTYAVRLMQHLVVPTFVLDPQRRVVVWNRACERLTGVAAQDVLGTSDHWRGFYDSKRYCLADLVALEKEADSANLYLECSVPESGVGLRAENWCTMPKHGSQLYLAIDAGPIYNEQGDLIAVVETLRDMTDQKRAEDELKALASSDGLTGLANRRTFDQAVDVEWSRAQRTRKPMSILIADVDNFKLFNDHHGHQRGDDCLRSVASVIQINTHRPADLCARYGGEEFAIVMPDTDLSDARAVSERLLQTFRERKIVHGAAGAGPHVTLSIGLASMTPFDGADSADLLRRADHALYNAKRSGRNQICEADEIINIDSQLNEGSLYSNSGSVLELEELTNRRSSSR